MTTMYYEISSSFFLPQKYWEESRETIQHQSYKEDVQHLVHIKSHSLHWNRSDKEYLTTYLEILTKMLMLGISSNTIRFLFPKKNKSMGSKHELNPTLVGLDQVQTS